LPPFFSDSARQFEKAHSVKVWVLKMENSPHEIQKTMPGMDEIDLSPAAFNQAFDL
jgi:hypothetical protein